jgi:hypothetical protein
MRAINRCRSYATTRYELAASLLRLANSSTPGRSSRCASNSASERPAALSRAEAKCLRRHWGCTHKPLILPVDGGGPLSGGDEGGRKKRAPTTCASIKDVIKVSFRAGTGGKGRSRPPWRQIHVHRSRWCRPVCTIRNCKVSSNASFRTIMSDLATLKNARSVFSLECWACTRPCSRTSSAKLGS